jgi:hypothetical protein
MVPLTSRYGEVNCEVTDGEGSLTLRPAPNRLHWALRPPTSSDAVERVPRSGGVLSAFNDAKNEGPISWESAPFTLDPRRLPKFENVYLGRGGLRSDLPC